MSHVSVGPGMLARPGGTASAMPVTWPHGAPGKGVAVNVYRVELVSTSYSAMPVMLNAAAACCKMQISRV